MTNIYKAIVSDFDGTLVGPDFKISPNVKDAVDRWRASGRYFSIATGKTFSGIIEQGCQYLELNDPIIVASGSKIVNPRTRENIYTEYIGKDDVKKVREILDKAQIVYELQTDTNVYASNESLKKLQKHKIYEDITSFAFQEVLLIRLITTKLSQTEINAFVDAHITRNFPGLHTIQSDTPYSKGINITSKDATKHMAVLRLAKMLHITPREIIGIGDAANDYSLLTACGYKVAMGNAVDELKEIADEVTADYRHDGVAVFINKILSQ